MSDPNLWFNFKYRHRHNAEDQTLTNDTSHTCTLQ